MSAVKTESSVSRIELLNWVNTVFQLNLQKIEQCSNGAVYCQIIDACHPGSMPMKKVNWAGKAEHECIWNYKALQQVFDRHSIARNIEVDKLIRGKCQGNFEFLLWLKGYYGRTYAGDEYDPLARRFADNLPEWARPRDGSLRSQMGDMSGPNREFSVPASRQSRRGAASPGPPKVVGLAEVVAVEGTKDEEDRLREEIVDLNITVQGLETERDMYFQKLRDIEILCQAVGPNPDPNMTVVKFCEGVQRVLYDEGDKSE
eukprot:TRINITY_DN25622_c0_g1_i1.p1 TRINITY_DN25622_c0_g1~~TRINITY_DN25622_c0_g1_i1.p1  ORF type:complete len:259 (-),score=36.92 TRINITY_DN25622_c0_g1_i1:62-838(-)